MTSKELTWTSSNTAVAKVDKNGMVTACGAGSAVITATTTDGSRLKATCAVTVPTWIQPTSVNFSVTSILGVNEEGYKCSASISPGNSSMTNVTYTSSDESVLTIDADGTLHALKVGTADVTAHLGNLTSTAKTVTVTMIGSVYEIGTYSDAPMEWTCLTNNTGDGDYNFVIGPVIPEKQSGSLSFGSNPALVNANIDNILNKALSDEEKARVHKLKTPDSSTERWGAMPSIQYYTYNTNSNAYVNTITQFTSTVPFNITAMNSSSYMSTRPGSLWSREQTYAAIRDLTNLSDGKILTFWQAYDPSNNTSKPGGLTHNYTNNATNIPDMRINIGNTGPDAKGVRPVMWIQLPTQP